MTHRDPVDVVGSACSLLRLVRPMFSDKVDMKDIAAKLLDTFDLMIERQNAYRDRHGEDAIHDIQYDQQMRDPIGMMRKVYERFEEPFTQPVEATAEEGHDGKEGVSTCRSWGSQRP